MTLTWLMMAAHVPADGHRGGMVRYVVEVARQLADRPDVELHVVADPAARSFWEPLVRSPKHIYPMLNVPTPAQAWLERRGRGSAAFGRRFDVVHGTKHLLPPIDAGMKLLTAHDFLPLDRPGDFGWLKRRLLPAPYLASIDEADAILCVSQATRDRLISYRAVAGERAHVVPLAGSSLSSVKPSVAGALNNRRFALVVGDDSARKNLRFVVDLWPQVARAEPDLLLAIVGAPAWRQEESAATEHPNVLRMGFLPDDQLAWCYANASVVLCPSVLEGFGLPAREALGFGARVLTSEDPALCEASGRTARHVYADDPKAWTEAIVAAVNESGAVPVDAGARSRTWTDVVDETVEVALACLDR